MSMMFCLPSLAKKMIFLGQQLLLCLIIDSPLFIYQNDWTHILSENSLGCNYFTSFSILIEQHWDFILKKASSKNKCLLW